MAVSSVVLLCASVAFFVTCIVVSLIVQVKTEPQTQHEPKNKDSMKSTLPKEKRLITATSFDFEPGNGISVVLFDTYHAETICGGTCLTHIKNRGLRVENEEMIRQPLYVHSAITIEACSNIVNTTTFGLGKKSTKHLLQKNGIDGIEHNVKNQLVGIVKGYANSINCRVEDVHCLVFLSDLSSTETKARSVFKIQRCDSAGECIEEAVRIKPACGDLVLWVESGGYAYEEEGCLQCDSTKHIMNLEGVN